MKLFCALLIDRCRNIGKAIFKGSRKLGSRAFGTLKALIRMVTRLGISKGVCLHSAYRRSMLQFFPFQLESMNYLTNASYLQEHLTLSTPTTKLRLYCLTSLANVSPDLIPLCPSAYP